MNLGSQLCLALDLRSGDQVGVCSKQKQHAKQKNINFLQRYLDAVQDIEAAIDYAYNKQRNLLF